MSGSAESFYDFRVVFSLSVNSLWNSNWEQALIWIFILELPGERWPPDSSNIRGRRCSLEPWLGSVPAPDLHTLEGSRPSNPRPGRAAPGLGADLDGRRSEPIRSRKSTPTDPAQRAPDPARASRGANPPRCNTHTCCMSGGQRSAPRYIRRVRKSARAPPG